MASKLRFGMVFRNMQEGIGLATDLSVEHNQSYNVTSGCQKRKFWAAKCRGEDIYSCTFKVRIAWTGMESLNFVELSWLPRSLALYMFKCG